MFSGLSPLYKILMRHAESTDTRQEMHKDETRVQNLNNDDQSAGNFSPLLWEDSTSVSVSALKYFLEAILAVAQKQSRPEVQTPPPEDVVPTEQPEMPPVHTPDAGTQRALNAYKSTAIATGSPEAAAMRPTPIMETIAPDPSASDITTDLREEDIQLVKQFILDLTQLELRGVRDLEIDRGQTFLESVRLAITVAKERYGL